ncbi:MAG TPA: DUF1707 domain-containing protein [Gemmatimonadales bacterium]|jgi:hypothetical protein
MNEPQLPAQLPTPERRDAVVAKLSSAFASGRIEMEDFELRTERAMRAQTAQDLEAALDGLVSLAPAPVQNSGEFVIDKPRRRTSRLTVSVMSGTDRKGKWTPARRHIALAWMGGAHLDFREALLLPGETDIYCLATWGGIEIAVPPGIDVEVSGMAIMGGLSRVAQQGASTDPRRPRLHIHALAVMGGIEIRVMKPGDRWLEDEAEAEEDGDE